jgi:selenide,water dikinase
VVFARATAIDPDARTIALDGRPPVAYDVASLAVGATVCGLDLPGVREHAVATRPIRDWVDRLASLPVPRRIAIVGGGAAGVELGFTLRARFHGAHVSVLSDGELPAR